MSDKKLYSCLLSDKIRFKTEFFNDKSIHLHIYQVFLYLSIIHAIIITFMYSFFLICFHSVSSCRKLSFFIQ